MTDSMLKMGIGDSWWFTDFERSQLYRAHRPLLESPQDSAWMPVAAVIRAFLPSSLLGNWEEYNL